MAVLTSEQLTEIRQRLATKATEQGFPVDYTKPIINVAAQAVEDWFEANRPSLSAAINAATNPLVLTASQKKFLVAYWFYQKIKIEGA